MRDQPYLVVSDVHLGSVPESTERRFRRFLRFAAETAGGLLINGDLFDFWFEYRTVIPRKHYRTLATLAEVVEAGVPVSFLGGNHDAWVGDFLKDEVGIELLEGPVEMELAGRRALVAHGDGVGEGDWGYRLLKRLIRSRLAVGAFRQLHPDWGTRVADRVSRTEDRLGGEESGRNRARHIRSWAEQELRRRPELDLVLAGHCHVPEVTEVEPGRFYANSGDWIHNSSAYLVLPAGGGAPALRSWEED